MVIGVRHGGTWSSDLSGDIFVVFKLVLLRC